MPVQINPDNIINFNQLEKKIEKQVCSNRFDLEKFLDWD